MTYLYISTWVVACVLQGQEYVVSFENSIIQMVITLLIKKIGISMWSVLNAEDLLLNMQWYMLSFDFRAQ